MRANARELVRLYDVVVDGTDTFGSRYLINDACVLEGKPDVYGSIFRFDGQVSVFGAAGGPCYRCLYPEAAAARTRARRAPRAASSACSPESSGRGRPPRHSSWCSASGRRWSAGCCSIDALDARVREVRIARDPACPLCGDAPTCRTFADDRRARARADDAEIAAADLDALLARDRKRACSTCASRTKRSSARPAGAVAIPAAQLEARLHELDPTAHYVVACRVGAKSRWAAAACAMPASARPHLRDGLLAYAALDEASTCSEMIARAVRPRLPRRSGHRPGHVERSVRGAARDEAIARCAPESSSG